MEEEMDVKSLALAMLLLEILHLIYLWFLMMIIYNWCSKAWEKRK